MRLRFAQAALIELRVGALKHLRIGVEDTVKPSGGAAGQQQPWQQARAQTTEHVRSS